MKPSALSGCERRRRCNDALGTRRSYTARLSAAGFVTAGAGGQSSLRKFWLLHLNIIDFDGPETRRNPREIRWICDFLMA
jgi:hypothetical protein